MSVSPLKRVNVFTGTNGSGKTSVLEIPFLLAAGSNASSAMKLYTFRNETRFVPNLQRPFTGLFYEMDVSESIIIEGEGGVLPSEAEKAHRRLLISPIYGPGGKLNGTKEEAQIAGLTFGFEGPSGELTGTIAWETPTEAVRVDLVSQMAAVAAALKIHSPENNDLIQGYFTSPFRELWEQAHKMLTELTKKNRVMQVVEHLKMIEPRIQNLIPLSDLGIETIYANIQLENLIPVALLGGGFANILHIVLNASVLRNGILIIDEIEDGLHHSVIPKLVRYLLKTSEERNLQLFISTHSDEILSVFAETASATDFQDLGLFRLWNEDGEGTASYFSFEDFLSLRESKAELR